MPENDKADIEEAGISRRNFHYDAGPGKTGSRLHKVIFESFATNEAMAQLVTRKAVARGVDGSKPPHTMHYFAV